MALITSNNASLLPPSTAASSFLKNPTVTKGYNLGTPAATQPTNTGLLTSGLSIGSGGQALVNGQTPAPYKPVSQAAGALIGTLPGQTNPNTQPAVNYGTPTTATKPTTTSAPQATTATSAYIPSNTAGGIGSRDIPQYNYTQNYGGNTNFPGLLNLLTNTASQGTPEVQSAQDKYQEAVQQKKQLKTNLADALATNAENPIPLVFQQGRAQVLQNQAASQLDAAQQAVNEQQAAIGQAQTAQGQQLGALGTAAGLAQPVTQAGLLTNPQTGQPLNPSVVASAVQQATQLVQNGADVNSPQVQALLNPFGFYGAQAFTAAQQALSGGKYNPSSQSAIVQQNLSQGQQYQAQAQGISNSLQLLGSIQPQLVNFMTQTQQNPSSVPLLNTQINKINQQSNPAAYATMNALVGETKSFVQQMLQAAGGMTPTDAGQVVSSYDFGTFTPTQLQSFLQNMEVAGNYRLSQAQSASQSGYNAGSNPAQGVNANTNQSLQNAGENAINSLPTPFKAILGSGSSLFGAAGNALSQEGGSIAGSALGTGLAETVLGL